MDNLIKLFLFVIHFEKNLFLRSGVRQGVFELIHVVSQFRRSFGAETYLMPVEQSLQFLVDGGGREGNTNMGFDPPSSAMEDRPDPQISFGNSEGFFNLPQVAIVLGDCLRRQFSVGDISLQSIPENPALSLFSD